MVGGNVVGLAHTGVTVSDMDRAISFFGGVLGGEVVQPVLYDDPVFERITGVKDAVINIAYVNFSNHTLELLEYRKPEDRMVTPSRPCDPGHLHLSLNVEGIEELAQRMAEAGFETVGPIQHVEVEGGFDVIYTYGFDGLVIELMDFSKK
ncbi:VOC family protein [Novosphingobium sp. B-7]|uniref:VOC family protein n=1 Tax=Novosphingobium sp. B-7 TaxID=1298855 RepID=UPI000688D482|nr:VOC family protein [Novosphingobium sp. B-7]